MKKLSLFVALVLVVALFSGCGVQKTVPETTGQTTEQATVLTTEEQVVIISVKKETLADAEAFLQDMKEYGAEVQNTDNEDGYIFEFSQAEHKKLLEEKHKETVEKFKEYEDNPEHYIDSIEYDDDFRNLTLNVNKELYDNGADSSGNIVVAATALAYQLYLEDGQRTTVKVLYTGTEEVVSQFTLPMNLSIEQ